MSAAIAPHIDEYPANVRITNTAFTLRAKAMFYRITASARRECRISHGSFARSSDMRTTSAVSIAASVPTAPIAMPIVARPIAGASFTPSPATSDSLNPL